MHRGGVRVRWTNSPDCAPDHRHWCSTVAADLNDAQCTPESITDLPVRMGRLGPWVHVAPAAGSRDAGGIRSRGPGISVRARPVAGWTVRWRAVYSGRDESRGSGGAGRSSRRKTRTDSQRSERYRRSLASRITRGTGDRQRRRKRCKAWCSSATGKQRCAIFPTRRQGPAKCCSGCALPGCAAVICTSTGSPPTR